MRHHAAMSNSVPTYFKHFKKPTVWRKPLRLDGAKHKAHNGVLITAPCTFDEIDLRHYEVPLIVRSEGFKCRLLRLSHFSNDGWHQCADGFDVEELEISVPLDLHDDWKKHIDTVKHPDGVQFIPLDENGKQYPDERGVIRNGRIGKITIVARTNHETKERGIQGFGSFNGTLDNCRFGENGIDIASDVDEHGFSFVHALNCSIGSHDKPCRIYSPSGTHKPGIVISDRKQGRVSDGNKIINVDAEFFDVDTGACEMVGCNANSHTQESPPLGPIYYEDEPIYYDNETEQPEVLRMSKADLLQWAATELDIESELIEAVDLQESGNGKGFWKGNPKILFEPVKFTQGLTALGFELADIVSRYPEARELIAYENPRRYGSLSKQWQRHLLAMRINKEVAIECCSWGYFSVMGNNWEALQYDSAEHFRREMDSEAGQFKAFVLYMKNKPKAIDALRRRDWVQFKRLYNGPGKNDYAAELAQKYRRVLARQSPNKSLPRGGSRSVNAQALDAGTKVIGGGGLIVAGLDSLDGVTDALDSFKDKAEQIEDVKVRVLEVTDQIKVLTGDLDAAKETIAAMSWMPWAIGGLIFVLLIPNIRTVFAYLHDNGYLRLGGRFR